MSETPAAEDAAWVKVELPIAPEPLYRSLCDIERLLRLNPFLELDRVERRADGALRLAGRNESNGQPLDLVVRVAEGIPGRLLVLRYDKGIKRETRCEIAPAGAGALLTITDRYETPAGVEGEQRMSEVDRSLVPWAVALRNALLRSRRWAWLPGYGYVVDRYWLRMTPRQRRVARLIVWTTVLEFIVFLFVLAIYAVEQARR